MSQAARKSVLICDDEQEIRELVRDAVLQVAPTALVIEAVDGTDAYQKVGKQRFDLIVLDINMPKRDGYQLFQSFGMLPEADRPKATIVLSAHIVESHTRAQIKAVAYLPKPCTIEELKKNILAALEPGRPAAGAAINVDFINPFIQGTMEVLKVTCSTVATKEQIFVRKGDQISGDISAVIALNSSKFKGSVALSFQEATFLSVVSKMLGETFTSITPEIQDAAGELCNQIFGIAKRVLNEAGHDIAPAIPSVISGKGHTIKHMANGPVIAVRFGTDAGKFVIEASLG